MNKDTMIDDNAGSNENGAPAIISAIRSPLSMFALIMLVYNGVFAYSAAQMNDIEAFKYTIHMFLGIVGSFVMIAMWCPRSLYHPKELKGLSGNISDARFPKFVVTAVLMVLIFSYGGYQYYKLESVNNALECLSTNN